MTTEESVPDEIAQLVERLESEESLDFEVKAARGGLPNSIWPTISAFANSQGGWLVLGIAERDGRLVAEGVDRPHAVAQQLADLLRNPQRISFPVAGGADLRISQIGQAQIVVLRVPPSPRQNRPVFVDRNPYDGTFIRGHSGDHRCTRQEVDRMMREASSLPADQVILGGYLWEDLDRSSFANYRRRFQTLHLDSPHNNLDDDAFLSVIGGFRRDRETGQQGITIAGLLMFGTEEAIRSWRGRHLFDFRTVAGDPFDRILPDWSDRFVWEGNLLGAFDTIYRRLIESVPIPFQLSGGVRVETGPHHVAIRESLVNLLVHADYRETDSSLVIRSERGFLMRNPGNSRVHRFDPGFGDRSDPRNPGIVRMFRMIGLAEEAGSGVPRIVDAWRSAGHVPPSFDLGIDRYEFTIGLRYTDLIEPDDRRWLEALDIRFHEEKLALIAAYHHGEVDNASLRQLTGQHPVDATRTLGALRDSGLLRMFGTGRGARYGLDPAAAALHVRSGASTIDISTPDMIGPSSSIIGLEPSTIDRATSTVDELVGMTAENLLDNEEELFVGSAEWQRLSRIAEPVAESMHIDAETRDRVIVELCRHRPLSNLELMWLTNRNKAYLRTVLKALVDQGCLAYEFPDRPRHPHQRYRATQSVT